VSSDGKAQGRADVVLCECRWSYQLVTAQGRVCFRLDDIDRVAALSEMPRRDRSWDFSVSERPQFAEHDAGPRGVGCLYESFQGVRSKFVISVKEEEIPADCCLYAAITWSRSRAAVRNREDMQVGTLFCQFGKDRKG